MFSHSKKEAGKHEINSVLLGNSGTGKTVFGDWIFNATKNKVGTDPTIGANYLKSNSLNATAWDTAGQERYR